MECNSNNWHTTLFSLARYYITFIRELSSLSFLCRYLLLSRRCKVFPRLCRELCWYFVLSFYSAASSLSWLRWLQVKTVANKNGVIIFCIYIKKPFTVICFHKKSQVTTGSYIFIRFLFTYRGHFGSLSCCVNECKLFDKGPCPHRDDHKLIVTPVGPDHTFTYKNER